MFNNWSRKNYVWSWSRTFFEGSERTRYYRTFIVRIPLNTYIISGSQNPRLNRPCQRQGSSNPPRVDNVTGYTNTSHPNPSTGIASLPPRPATVAKDSPPRNAEPNYGFDRGSTLSSSMHIPPKQPVLGLGATNEPLKVTTTKTSSKPSLYSIDTVKWRRRRWRVRGSGGGGGTESLNPATPSHSRFQPVSRYSIYLIWKDLEMNLGSNFTA